MAPLAILNTLFCLVNLAVATPLDEKPSSTFSSCYQAPTQILKDTSFEAKNSKRIWHPQGGSKIIHNDPANANTGNSYVYLNASQASGTNPYALLTQHTGTQYNNGTAVLSLFYRYLNNTEPVNGCYFAIENAYHPIYYDPNAIGDDPKYVKIVRPFRPQGNTENALQVLLECDTSEVPPLRQILVDDVTVEMTGGKCNFILQVATSPGNSSLVGQYMTFYTGSGLLENGIIATKNVAAATSWSLDQSGRFTPSLSNAPNNGYTSAYAFYEPPSLSSGIEIFYFYDQDYAAEQQFPPDYTTCSITKSGFFTCETPFSSLIYCSKGQYAGRGLALANQTIQGCTPITLRVIYGML